MLNDVKDWEGQKPVGMNRKKIGRIQVDRSGVMEFTPAKLKAFKKEYEKARRDSKEQFGFEGGVFVTTYAKYVIEYLEGIWGKNEQP